MSRYEAYEEYHRERPNGRAGPFDDDAPIFDDGATPPEPDDMPPPMGEHRKDTIEPLRLSRFSDFYGVEPPARSWIIPNWIPAEGEVTLFYGDGGIGKSFMAMQLQFAAAMS